MAVTAKISDIKWAADYLKANTNLSFFDFRGWVANELKGASSAYCDSVANTAWHRVYTGSYMEPDAETKTPLLGSPAWYLAEFERVTTEMLSITRAKNSDYTGGQPTDAFHNFRFVEFSGITSVEVGILTRMSDKFARIAALLKPGHEQKVKDESVEDTLKDLANYSIILLLYLRCKRQQMIAASPKTVDEYNRQKNLIEPQD